MKIGAQLFTVRDFCKDLPSFAETLKKVADIGYTTVQVSGTCEYDPDWLKEELAKNGIMCAITHTAPQKLESDIAQVCADHKHFGCPYVGLGMYRFRMDDLEASYEEFLQTYKPIAKALKENGLYLMYHNHHYEFAHINGQPLLQRIAQDFAPDELGVTLDTFWVQAGGGNSVEWIEKLSGRLPCIHLKDFRFANTGNFKDNMAVVGEGNINFEPIIRSAEAAGTKYLMVEQDDCHGEDPFDCLKRSYDNLKAMGLD